jgi:hypothetical protein
MSRFSEHKGDLPALVKYDCGCIGFQRGPGRRALLVYWCDHDGRENPVGLGMRGMGEKEWDPVSEDRALELFEEIADLTDSGERFRELKRILG